MTNRDDRICRYYPDCEIHRGAIPTRAIAPLSPRQAECLALIAAGAPDREIAERWGVHITTVHQHVEDLRTKLGARNRAHAVAIGYGLTIQGEKVGHGG